MKHLPLILSLSFLISVSSISFGQNWTPLYVGYASVSSIGNQIHIMDTTGGTYTQIGTLTLTNDIGTAVSGCHGLDISPANQQMYILYQDIGLNLNRRLGILDTISGLITDIGVVGNMTDIAFRADGTLYGTSGNPDGRQFYDINITDASTTLLYNHILPTWSTGICYDEANDRVLMTSQGPGAFIAIDLTTYAETNLGVAGHPGWTTCMKMKNPDEAIVMGGTAIYELNLIALTWSFIGPLPDFVHALSFGSNGLAVVVNGPTTFCANEPSILTLSDTGTTFQWQLDGIPIGGATDSSWVPISSGTYDCVVNGTDTASSVVITVLPAPTAAFTATPNPIDLGIVPSGNVDFTNTTTGGNEYHWDFDNGFTTTLTDPSMAFTSTGFYDVMLIAIDTITGCSDTVVVTVTVTNSTGIDELQADFEIYPVPTEGIVYVSMSGGSGTYELELRDLQGKLIELKKVGAESSTVYFDLSDYDSGIYLIKVFNREEEGYFKILKK